MSGWLYLIRNKDLYKIGITKNLKQRMQKLKPDKIVIKFYTSEYLKLERHLHYRYRKYRIPQTEYFRLKKIHLKELKKIISNLNYPYSLTLLIFARSLLLLCLVFFIVFIFISLKINELNIVLKDSLYFMEGISIGLCITSLFVNSGRYFSLCNEVKFRTTKIISNLLFFFFFRIANIVIG
tara:strand:- start:86 stop:628 length:543 start_codon:yes stop_codon:yes gene_type:complete